MDYQERNEYEVPSEEIYRPAPKRSLEGSARLQFVQKVYSLLTIQLVFTVLAVVLSCNSPAFARFQARNYWLAIVSIVVTFVTIIALSYGELSKKSPTNYALLGLFTLAESYLVSMICTFYDEKSVLMCGVLTLAVTAGLTLHALTTKKDYSAYLAGLAGIVSILLWVGVANFFFRIQAIQNLMSVAFAAIYMVYILVDTQLIMGGSNRRFKLTLDDYIMGTMILYIDIVGLFLKLLEILGDKKRKD